MKRLAIAAIWSLAAAGMAHAADETPLADAVQAGDAEAALEMILDGTEVNNTQVDGSTPLLWAVYNVDHDLTAALLEAGADPDATNKYGATPMGEAVKVADVELVSMLLEAGADPDAPNADGQTALTLATDVGSLEIAELLVAAGADVNAVEQFRHQTALMWAADMNRPEIATLLIDNGARVDIRSEYEDWARQITSEPRAQYRPTGGYAPLGYAARGGCYECAVAMVEAGADVDQANPDGITPLMTAIDNYNFDIAKYLIEQGARLDTWDAWGRTPLYIAVDMSTYRGQGGFGFGGGIDPPEEVEANNEALEVARILLERGVDPDPQLTRLRPARGGAGRFLDDSLRSGATPLFRATLAYDFEAIEMLLEYGARPNLPNVMGNTPFMAAAGMGTAPRDSRGNYGGDVQARAIRAMEIFLAEGADVNKRIDDTSSWTARIARPSSMTDRQGQTAIFGAIKWGWADVVQWLIDHGADVNVVDDFGRTPLDAAHGDGGGRTTDEWPEIIAILEEAGARRSDRQEAGTDSEAEPG